MQHSKRDRHNMSLQVMTKNKLQDVFPVYLFDEMFVELRLSSLMDLFILCLLFVFLCFIFFRNWLKFQQKKEEQGF